MTAWLPITAFKWVSDPLVTFSGDLQKLITETQTWKKHTVQGLSMGLERLTAYFT